MSATTYGWLILAAPLAGSITIGAGWRKLSPQAAGILGVGAIAVSFLSALGALWALLDVPVEERQMVDSLYTYADLGGIKIDLSILVDPLAVFMALTVSGVSMLIHLYSLAYMRSDEGYRRFFAYLNFFVFSMLLLILAGNFVLLIVGWAFVGYASYALISFWYRRNTATAAGMKAFVINVVGDIGLVLAAILLLRELGSVDYLTVFDRAPQHFAVNQPTAIAICLLICVGAFAKSAQLPFHTWLADAMEGPTPVSALIHAATMVTAGVYLIARAHPLFELAPTAADIAAFVGLTTLIFAGTVALVVTDLKRIIAYSTMSQIGYMIMGVSIGAYGAGMFHLMTHAFFKALLFMAAGSIIAAMASRQNIDRMSGFARAMPFTSGLLVVGSLALAGFPPFSGFFSKDEILVFAAERGGMYWIFAIGGYVGAFLTAFYSFRIVFRVCFGDPCEEAEELIRTGLPAHGPPENPVSGEPEDVAVGFPGADHHIAEKNWEMKLAMGTLGVLALLGGLIQIPGVSHLLESFFDGSFGDSKLYTTVQVPTGTAWAGLLIGALTSLLAISLAHHLYISDRSLLARIRAESSQIHDFLAAKWYFDELLDLLIYRPLTAVGRFFDGFAERWVVGGVVGGTVAVVRRFGSLTRTAQSGYLRFYAAVLSTGTVGLGLYFLIASS